MPPRARARWKHVFSWILRRRHPSPERCPDGAGRLWARPLRRAQTAPRGPGRLLPTAACLAGRQAGLERRGPPQDGAEPAGGTLQEPGAGGSPKLAKVLPGGAGARKTWAAPVPRQARTEMKPGRQVQAARRPQARKRRATRTPGLGLPGPEARQVRTARERRVSRKPGRPWCGRGFPTIRGAAAGRGSGAAVPARRTAQGW